MIRRLLAATALSAAFMGLAACAQTQPAAEEAAAPPAAPAPPASTQAANDYSQPQTWLCRPGRQDACSTDLTTTVVAGDGTMTREAFAADPNAPIDCFYVYPTVSRDPSGNSDMNAGYEEISVAAVQAARFQSKCRVFAPLYRQVTGTAMVSNMAGRPMQADRNLAYNDVRAAWNHYLEHDNNGRGVVLIGHSQGSGILTQLMVDAIDGKPIQRRLVSALLIGSSVSVPRGANVGGAFQSIPACRSATQIGCVISYAAFRDTVPPPENSMFGRPGRWETPNANNTVICTNPANLSGNGSGELHSYFTTTGEMLGSPLAPPAWTTSGGQVTTTFASTPGLVSARCVSDARGTYLALHVNANPNDARIDDIAGDIKLPNGQVDASWGMHMIDMQVAMGNLVDIVGRQGAAYVRRR